MLTATLIKRFAPSARANLVQALVDGWPRIVAAEINTPLRLQHFMAQIATETGGLKAIEENLNYSAERLVQVWPARFKSVAAATPYAHNPGKLANKVYGGRLGNKEPDDGWRYRGGGFMQTTGRSNYAKAGFEDDPDALRNPDSALDAALTFWTDNGCNAIADTDNVTALRKRVNGGTNGLADCKVCLAKAKKTFTKVALPTASAPVQPLDTTAAGMDPAEHVAQVEAGQTPDAAPAGSPPVPLPAEPVAPGLAPFMIKAAQQRLLDLGYFAVGIPDENPGTSTIAAVSKFQATAGIPVTGQFDQATIDRLGADDAPRAVVSAMRKDITAGDLKAAGSRTIQATTAGKIEAGWKVLTGVLGVGTTALVNGWDEAWAKVQAVNQAIGGNGSTIVIGGLAALTLYFGISGYVRNRAIEEAKVDDVRTGKAAT